MACGNIAPGNRQARGGAAQAGRPIVFSICNWGVSRHGLGDQLPATGGAPRRILACAEIQCEG